MSAGNRKSSANKSNTVRDRVYRLQVFQGKSNQNAQGKSNQNAQGKSVDEERKWRQPPFSLGGYAGQENTVREPILYTLTPTEANSASEADNGIVFYKADGNKEVGRAEDVHLVVDWKTGSWWLRHKMRTFVSVHVFKWQINAHNEDGAILFTIARTQSQRRQHGDSWAEFWGVDERIVSAGPPVASWTLVGYGEFRLDED